MFRKQCHKTLLLLTCANLLMSGCYDGTAEVAREAANRQAQQNTELSTLNREVASGTHRLVEADAQARREIIGVHHELAAERSRLDSSRDALEQDRRQIAGERRTESTLFALAEFVGGPLLVIVVVSFCWRALVNSASGTSSDADLNQLLVREILSGEPRLISDEHLGPNAIRHSKSAS